MKNKNIEAQTKFPGSYKKKKEFIGDIEILSKSLNHFDTDISVELFDPNEDYS